jgi:hypothetical protein
MTNLLHIHDRVLRYLVLAALLVLTLLGADSAQAQALTEDQKIDLTVVGDATVTITDHYSAAAWLNWQDSIGDHPDLVVRNFKREYAAWDITDFSFSKDEVQRISESKMKVRAFAQLNREGEYKLDRLPTGLHLVTNKENEWIFGGRISGGGDEDDTDLTIHVILPPGAINAHVVNPDSSHTELVYSVASHGSKFSPLLLLAIFLAIIGAVALGFSRVLPDTLGGAPQFLAIRKIVAPSMLLGGSGKWQLVGRTPEGAALRLDLNEKLFASNGNRLVIGRTAELCHLLIDTKSVSKQHAQIRLEGGVFKIADRNSSNGTAVNGQFCRAPFDEVPLKEGDTLTFGDVKLDFSKV